MNEKSYFIMRKDLNMTPAKLGINVGHGVDFVHLLSYNDTETYNQWLANSRKKVVLQIDDLDSLIKMMDKLHSDCVRCHIIEDNGLTEFDGRTTTGIVVMPISEDSIPKYLKRLRLYKI